MHDPEDPYVPIPPKRVPTSTVFTFERPELEQMIREAVQPSCPPGMYLDHISFEIVDEYPPLEQGPPISTFKSVKVHFAKLKPGR